jgi:hypothetical protein
MNYSKSVFSLLCCVKPVVIITLVLCSMSACAQWSSVVSNNIYTFNSGNVGIGSTAPVYKLEVVSPSNARLLVKSTASPNPAVVEAVGPSSTAVIESVTSPSAITRIGSRTNHDVSFITNNTEKVVIKADGKVGIGKTPVFSLDVNGSFNATTINLAGQPLVNSQWISNGTNINFSSGIVSIGTTRTPLGFKLAVGGKIVAEELLVRMQTNWPDYVFADEYKLPPLSDVNKYIMANKHLPDLPTAQQVYDHGIPIGELNATLVKKIEELTLYLIEQEKRIEILENHLAQK